MYCPVCRGSRQITLPHCPRLESRAFAPDVSVLLQAEIYHKTYPCPECSPQIENGKLLLLHETISVDFRFAPQATTYVKQDIACHLGMALLKGDLITFTEKENRENFCLEITGTIGVASPRLVVDLFRQVKHHAYGLLTEFANYVSANITNWNIRATSVTKNQVKSEIQSSLHHFYEKFQKET